MSRVKIEVTKDYKKNGSLILKKGSVYEVGEETANILIDSKKVAKIFGTEEPKKQTKK